MTYIQKLLNECPLTNKQISDETGITVKELKKIKKTGEVSFCDAEDIVDFFCVDFLFKEPDLCKHCDDTPEPDTAAEYTRGALRRAHDRIRIAALNSGEVVIIPKAELEHLLRVMRLEVEYSQEFEKHGE